VAAGCATTAVAPRTSGEVPVVEVDEQGLWQLAADAQGRLDAGGRILADPALEAYLLEVAHRVEPQPVFQAIPFRLRVLRDRTPNAFCLPNGAIYVHTGMLALLQSEAELAILLGHEMEHAVQRHALRSLRAAENTGALLNTLASWTGAAARPGGLVFLASVAGYGRDLEREADRSGLGRAQAAGYSVQVTPRLLERMDAWAKAEKVPQGSSFYASHPRLEERLENLSALLAGAPEGGELGAERYARQTAVVLLEAARADLAAGRLDQAAVEAERYRALRPEDAQAPFVLAEVARRRGAGQEAAALAAYREAVALDPKLAGAWRGLGLLLERQGDQAGARQALQRYLELAPDAPDRAHVRAALQRSERQGGTP
jgi:predicted Zn-dependent protease